MYSFYNSSFLLRHLASEVKCFSLFATHFQELVALANDIPNVANFHVTAMTGEEELTMLYKVRPGPSDRSFGLEVAKMAGFKESIIKVMAYTDFEKLFLFSNLAFAGLFLKRFEKTGEMSKN